MKYRAIEGWFEDEQLFRDIVAAAPDPAHFVEVGSWMGRSAACMAEHIRDSGKLIRFDQVDTFKGSEYGSHPGKVAALESHGITLRGEFEANLRDCQLWVYVNPVEGESVSVAATYEPWSLDCVFIDADHRADNVERDIRSWMPRIKPGGVLCGYDAQNPGVIAGIAAVGLKVEVTGSSWFCRKGYLPPPDYPIVEVEYPIDFPGVPRGWWYLKHGFERLGCKVHLSPELLDDGFWCPPRTLPGPIHIAALNVNGKRVWYDCSDFAQSHPKLGEPYFAKNALLRDLPEVQPIGQYLGTDPELMLANLRRIRTHTNPKVNGVLAVFSNIDEGEHGESLRRSVAQALRGRKGVIAGLWRWGKRPTIPAEIAVDPVDPPDHWYRIAGSRVVVCLPGVGGDSTRLRTEALAIGSAVLTVEGKQAWPGNWRGCWAEAKRDAESIVTACSELSADEAECRRLGRLGQWYFEANLRPERMAERMVRACV